MIGCFATAINETLQINQQELEDARWFHKEEIQQMVDGNSSFSIPPKDLSISQYLIRKWLANCEKHSLCKS